MSDDTPVGKAYGEGPVLKEDEILPTPMLDPYQIKRPQPQEVKVPQQRLTDDDILIA